MDDRNEESRKVILAKVSSVTNQSEFSNKDNEPEIKMKSDEKTEVNYVSNPDVFISKLKKAKATVSVVENKSEIIKEVHGYVGKQSFQENETITIADDFELNSPDWKGINVTSEYEPQTLSTSVTPAWMGIEETGTLVLLSSPSFPTGMNFLPDHHLVVLNADSIVKTMEDVWQVLRNSGKEIPRTINLISGPSRTADIEYEIEIGAHGPKYLHVVIYKNG